MNEQFRAHLAGTLGIDDAELQDELIAEYKRTVTDSIAQMKEAAAAVDFERLRPLGHALKGCALNIGHPAAHECSLGIENGAKESDIAACNARIAELIRLAAELE